MTQTSSLTADKTLPASLLTPQDAAAMQELACRIASRMPLTRETLREPVRQFMALLFEAAVSREMDAHLRQEKEEALRQGLPMRNKRNGFTVRQIAVPDGEPLAVRVPRDRLGTFHSALFEPWERRSPERIERILELSSRGFSARETAELIGALSGTPISADQVLDTLAKAEKRTKTENGAALPATFETVFATAVPVRLKADGGSFRPSALVLLTGFNAGDTPKLIGIYSLDEGPLEGRILQDLRIRGVEGINLFIQENIEGFEADLTKVFPGAAAALSPAALLDWSVRPLTKPEEQRVRPMLTGVLKAETPAAALRLLSNFEITSGVRLAGEIAEGWRNNWERIVPVIETEPARRADVFAAAAAEAAMLEVIHRRLQNGRPVTDAARAVSLVAVCARQALEESAAGART